MIGGFPAHFGTSLTFDLFRAPVMLDKFGSILCVALWRPGDGKSISEHVENKQGRFWRRQG
jgi:hypothetical protein